MERDAPWIADMLGNGANLIGHSWGGAEALLAAARRPETVHSLVLVEPALSAIAEADPSLRDNLSQNIPALSWLKDSQISDENKCDFFASLQQP